MGKNPKPKDEKPENSAIHPPASYARWLDKIYYSSGCPERFKILTETARLTLAKGPIVSFRYLSLMKGVDLDTKPEFYETFWKRLLLNVLGHYREDRPCFRLFQLHHWVHANPQHVDWGIRYRGFSSKNFLCELGSLVEMCSNAQCGQDLTKALIDGIKAQRACLESGGCWVARKDNCYKTGGFRFHPTKTERLLLEEESCWPPTLLDWFRRMVGDALMTTGPLPQIKSIDQDSKKLRPIAQEKAKQSVRRHLQALQNMSGRLVKLVTKIGHCVGSPSPRSTCKKDSQRAEQLIRKVEGLNRAVIRCQAIHGKKGAAVVECLRDTEEAVESLEKGIQSLERHCEQWGKGKASSSPTKWSLRWMVREVLNLVIAALGSLLSPWTWLWSKTVDYATRLNQWVRTNVLQTVLIVLVVVALSYGIITSSWAGILLSIVKASFFTMCKIFIWWCSLGFIKRTLLSLGLWSLDIILNQGITEENEKTLKRIQKLKNSILFIMKLLTPLCFLYNTFGKTLEDAGEKATGKPCDCECSKDSGDDKPPPDTPPTEHVRLSEPSVEPTCKPANPTGKPQQTCKPAVYGPGLAPKPTSKPQQTCNPAVVYGPGLAPKPTSKPQQTCNPAVVYGPGLASKPTGKPQQTCKPAVVYGPGLAPKPAVQPEQLWSGGVEFFEKLNKGPPTAEPQGFVLVHNVVRNITTIPIPPKENIGLLVQVVTDNVDGKTCPVPDPRGVFLGLAQGGEPYTPEQVESYIGQVTKFMIETDYNLKSMLPTEFYNHMKTRWDGGEVPPPKEGVLWSTFESLVPTSWSDYVKSFDETHGPMTFDQLLDVSEADNIIQYFIGLQSQGKLETLFESVAAPEKTRVWILQQIALLQPQQVLTVTTG
jgi:hypothetical protein